MPRRYEGFAHCGVLGIGVHPQYRGKGIGQRLLTEALWRRARQGGLEKVELEVYASNRSAKALYEKLGFEVEGIRKRARKLDGAYEDVILMGLLLDP